MGQSFTGVDNGIGNILRTVKIAMVYLPTSGSETVGDYDDYLVQLSAALAELGHTVTRDGSQPPLSSFRDCDHRTSSYAECYPPTQPAPSLSGEQLPAVLQQFAQHLLTTWGADRPDVVHAHHWAGALATELAAQRLGIPAVVTYLPSPQHAPDSAEEPRVGRAIARHANRLVALNTAHATQLTRLGRPRAHIGIIPCGVDVDHYHPTGPTTPRGPFTHRLLYASSGQPHDGTDTAIEILSRTTDTELLITYPHFTPANTNDHSREIGHLAEQFRVTDRVQLCGAVTATDLPALLRSADILLHLPHSDPLGSIALQAMACGLPVIASAVEALQDIVINELTGYLVAPDRPRECATTINQLLAEPFQRQALGAAGRNRTQSRYTWPRIATETTQFYQHAMAWPGPQ